MDVTALFDKLLVDLADEGVTEGRDGQARTLEFDGVPFARLAGETMSFRTPSGSAARDHADALITSEPAAPTPHQPAALADPAPSTPQWTAVPVADVSQWEELARQALGALRRTR